MIDCPVDDYTPLPTSSPSREGVMTYPALRERAAAACAAANLLDRAGYVDPPEDIGVIQEYAHAALMRASNGQSIPADTMREATSTPEGATYVNAILAEYDMDAVGEAHRLRHYVTNRLVVESVDPDPKIRLRALELLGKISNVGLFTERTEITVNNRSTVELENTLREKVRRLLNGGDPEDAVIVEKPVTIHELPSAKDMLSGE
jgi:hypothetical protein